MSHNPLAQYTLGQLRAWADARVISSAKYVEEVDRRRRAAALKIQETLGGDREDVAHAGERAGVAA